MSQLTIREPREAVVADETRGIEAVAAEDPEGTLYARTIEALSAYFNPRDNHLHYAVLFGSRVQKSDETNEHFIRDLHDMVAKCSGWDQAHKNDMLRIRLLAGMKDKELSRQLQVDSNITLEQIKKQLRTTEIIAQNQKAELDDEKQVLAIAQSSRQQFSQNQRGPSKKGQMGTLIKDCKYCGSDHVKGRCPAYKKQCNKCQKLGHFGKVCRSAEVAKQVNQLRAPDNDSSDDGDQFHVNVVSQVEGRNVEGSISSNKWLLQIEVQSKAIEARVDTGAEVSTMSKGVFLNLGCNKVTKTKARLTGMVTRTFRC